MPFILLKKRAKVVTSAKWSWSEICVMLCEVLRQQAEESEEDFLDALGETVFADAVLLDAGEVCEEEIVEHAQAVVGQRKKEKFNPA